ncbi:MAG: N-acetylneuraminate synthase family protein, partial [Planctomycetes bacterium]|nr:N-acetylneuraminate synthase family protein [Planctomycetota bacterium]
MNTGRPLLISTGGATLEEVRQTLRWLGVYPHLLLQCVSSYPTPDEAAALGGRLAMQKLSPTALGYSDHTTFIDTGALAVASGACLLEKHLTYNRQAIGPDHAASLDPKEFEKYVRLAHRASKMLGPIEKCVLPEELDIRETSRQSLTTRNELPCGHILRREDLTIKRPGIGISPSELDSVIGKQLLTSVDKDMPLLREHLN